MGTVSTIYSRNRNRPQYEGERKRGVLRMSEAIRNRKSDFGISVIAEFKRRSPSGFLNTENTDMREYLRSVIDLGVSGLSILTEPDFFSGSYEDVCTASEFNVPVLDKDFISNTEMVDSAYSAGADCILLIADFLDAGELKELAEHAGTYSMETLIEFHEPENIKKIPRFENVIVGYNRRNLRTLKMEGKEMEIIDTLKTMEVISVLESGLVATSIPDHAREQFDAFLIGESLLKSAGKEARQL